MRCTLFLLLTSLLGFSACSTVKYGDAGAVETVNTDFGSSDLQQIATSLVDDLLNFPPMVEITAKKRPIVFIDGIENKTTEHIDLESITDTIQNDLIRSGNYRFVDPNALARMKKQFNYQQQSGMVAPKKAAKIGRQLGAEYMLYGNMSSITKHNGSTKDVYYKFTLKLMDLTSGVLEWSGEKDIRKTRTKSLLGR